MALLVILWTYYDDKQLNKAVMYWRPFALLTLVLVSVGPLLYVALRQYSGGNDTQSAK